MRCVCCVKKQAESRLQELRYLLAEGINCGEVKPWNKDAFLKNIRAREANDIQRTCHHKSVFLALGINIEGQKELPGMWMACKASRMPSTQYIRRPASSYASCIWCVTARASCHGRTTKPSLAT